jgi:hypothetical protein
MFEQVLTSLGYADASANAIWHFVLLTLVIGGGAAWRTGQAVAQNWGELWPVVAYTALLAAGIRFLHFALFGGLLLSLPSYLVDFAILAVIAIVGYRVRRARHMTEQYGWMFERSGPLTWRDRT